MKYTLCRAGWGGTHKNRQTKQKKNTHKHSLPHWLCGGNLSTLRCLQRGLSSQSLGNYWQLNQSNQQTSTDKESLLCDDTQWIRTRKSYDKSTGQTQGHVPWICLPQGISQQYTPTTHTEAVHYQRSSWGLPSLSLTTEGSWIHLGGQEGRQISRQTADASSPISIHSDTILLSGWTGRTAKTISYTACWHAIKTEKLRSEQSKMENM